MNSSIEHVETPLRATQLHVVPRHLGNQRDLQVAACLISRLNSSDRGFDVVSDAAEEIELPTGIEAGVIDVLPPVAEPWNGNASLEFGSARRSS